MGTLKRKQACSNSISLLTQSSNSICTETCNIETCSDARPDRGEEEKEHFFNITFWNAGEAVKLFGIYEPENDDDNDDVSAVVKKRIEKLNKMWQTSGGWREGVDDLDSYILRMIGLL